jgi:hypothetical protein
MQEIKISRIFPYILVNPNAGGSCDIRGRAYVLTQIIRKCNACCPCSRHIFTITENVKNVLVVQYLNVVF